MATSRVIEKCGYLKIKRPPTSGKVRIKAWQSKYFVIRDLPPTFEYFKDELSFTSSHNTKEKNKINLENVIHIGTTDASRTQRNAFMIVDAHHGAIMLATDSEQETKQWVDVLKKVSGKSASEMESPDHVHDDSPVLPPRVIPPNTSTDSGRTLSSPVGENCQGFPVITRLTPSSEKVGIRDDYTMYITDEYAALHNVETNSLIVQWPLIGLRGWKSEPAESAGRRGTQLLTLKAGRKSATGEGLFQFFTDYGDHIVEKIRVHSNVLASAIENREKLKRSESLEDNGRDSLQSKPKPLSKAATDPHPIASFKTSSLLKNRAESDPFIFGKDRHSNLSPASLRRELLQEKLAKEISKDESETNCEGSELQSAQNMYLDLISDINANPVHVPDSEHRRRSLDSSSLNSDEGTIVRRSLINAANGINDCTESYIDDSEINTYNAKKSKVDDNNKENHVKQNVGTTIYSDPTNTKSFEAQKPVQNTTQLCADFLDQLSNPRAHQMNIFPLQEKHRSSLHFQEGLTKEAGKESTDTIGITATDISSQSTNATEDDVVTIVNNQSENKSTLIGPNEGSDPSEKTKAFDNFDQSNNVEESKTPRSKMNIKRPHSDSNLLSQFHEKGVNRLVLNSKEDAMDLLEKLVSNLETPQTCVKERLFPPLSKRDNVDTEQSISTKNEAPNEAVRHTEMAPKKTIEKSKSLCGFDSMQQTDKPPPLPVRRDIATHGRNKPSASLGDISKDLHRPIDVHRQLSTWGSHTPAFGVPWGPESVVSARLLHRSTSGTSLGAVKELPPSQHSIQDSEKTTKAESCDKPKARSMRSTGSFSPNQETECIAEDEFDHKKRRGSKASKMFSKVLSSLNPIDPTKRRSSCDIIPNGGFKDFDPKRGRSASIAPGGGIVNEAWSPDQSLDVPSPEGSPEDFRTSMSAGRRLSHDPNLDHKRLGTFFISSPTFENRTKEEMRLREKAKERERERSELPSEPPPQLPPRKKSDPPPLPPRLRKSSSDSSNSSSPNFKLLTQEQSSVSAVEKHDDITPPPVPPRKDDRRGSHPPAIQLTMSSPEARPEEPCYPSSSERASRSRQPSEEFIPKSQPLPRPFSTDRKDGPVSCPIPKRPPKTHGLWTAAQEVPLVDDRNSVVRKLRYENTAMRTNSETHAGFSNFERTSSSFVSIEMQERIHSEASVVVTRPRTHEERLELCDIERDSIDASPTSFTTTGSHSRDSGPAGPSSLRPGSVSQCHVTSTSSPQQSTASLGRGSPGHTPPALSLNLPPRNGGIVLGDSPTAPIIA